MKYKITFKFMEERAAEDDGLYHPLPLIHAHRPHAHQGEEDFYANEEHHEFLKRLTTLMYTIVLILVVIFLMIVYVILVILKILFFNNIHFVYSFIHPYRLISC